MKNTYTEIIHTSIPLILSTSGLAIMQFFDAMFLSWHSPVSLAAAGTSACISWALSCFLLGLMYYTAVLTSNYIGARMEEKVGKAIWQGIYLAAIEIAAYIIGFFYANPGAKLSAIWGATDAANNMCLNAVAMAFLAVNFGELFCAINMRSRQGSLFSKSMFRNFNWWLVGAFIVTAGLTLLPIYVPFLRDIFFPLADAKEHFTLELNELLISLLLAASTVPVFELGKALRRASERRKGNIV